jgi:hypothetical protein
MLHFMAVVPPEWRFRFMGSPESVAFVNKSSAIREMVRIGKLDLTYIPETMVDPKSQEDISKFLTTLELYETILQPAEHLLVFQTDSMLCANSMMSLDDYLDYDWVGAPWNPEGRWGGNGGLSLRKVSAIIDILRNQERTPKEENGGGVPEDVWLAERLAMRPNAKMANGTVSIFFSGEMHGGPPTTVKPAQASKIPEADRIKHAAGEGIDSDATVAEASDVDLWRNGFYEPMGYHTGDNGRTLHSAIWGTPALRKHVWDYCPEVKLIFEMDAAEYVPGECNANWRRDLPEFFESREEHYEMETGLQRRWDPENTDEEGYPYLPAGLIPW